MGTSGTLVAIGRELRGCHKPTLTALQLHNLAQGWLGSAGSSPEPRAALEEFLAEAETQVVNSFHTGTSLTLLEVYIFQ